MNELILVSAERGTLVDFNLDQWIVDYPHIPTELAFLDGYEQLVPVYSVNPRPSSSVKKTVPSTPKTTGVRHLGTVFQHNSAIPQLPSHPNNMMGNNSPVKTISKRTPAYNPQPLYPKARSNSNSNARSLTTNQPSSQLQTKPAARTVRSTVTHQALPPPSAITHQPHTATSGTISSTNTVQVSPHFPTSTTPYYQSYINALAQPAYSTSLVTAAHTFPPPPPPTLPVFPSQEDRISRLESVVHRIETKQTESASETAALRKKVDNIDTNLSFLTNHFRAQIESAAPANFTGVRPTLLIENTAATITAAPTTTHTQHESDTTY